jgi:predicted deacylase
MMQIVSRITAEIDFDRDGRQAGRLRAPLSRNQSAWGRVEIPLFVIKNGKGPSILFTGGIHGDEYEGPIAISRLAHSLDAGELQGRVILIPAVNIPAVLNDTRISPVDGRDLNRCFPGRPDGTFSEMLAHFLDAVILPLSDATVDVHTAGRSMEATPSTNMHYVSDSGLRARTMAAAAAFGAPFNVVFWGVDESATFTSAVERRGILSLGTELGGWGRVSIEGVRIASRGLRNILKHFGLIEGQPDTGQRDGRRGTRHMMVRDPSAYVFSPAPSLFEPCHLAGASVGAGDIAGHLHFVDEVDRPSAAVRYARGGTIWMAAGPGRVQRGDVLAVVMNDYDEAAAGLG